jgi:TPP-dependent pyruvate/acetoin dehydrogenase alpha subunit
MLYFTEEEKARNRARDPIESFRKRLLDRKLVTEGELAKIDAKVDAAINDAVAFAESSPMPNPAEVTTDVYVSYP